jgi:transketolase
LIAQRDAFLDNLFIKAKSDKDIILISVDMGAPSIDKWRSELSDQFFDMGISEQNAINFASGLSRGGKKVFVYFMAVWVLRCFEQIRYSSLMANNKITILGNGVGLGYAPAGPAHETSEDVGVMKTLHGINIWSPSSSESIPYIVNECINSSVTNYVRLERKSHSLVSYSLDSLISNQLITENKSINEKNILTIFTYGFLAGIALEAGEQISRESDTTVKVIDLQKIWPLPEILILEMAKKSNGIIVLEEQSLNGGISESISNILIRDKKPINFRTVSLPSKYIFENGTREQLLDNYGLSSKNIIKLATEMMATK